MPGVIIGERGKNRPAETVAQVLLRGIGWRRMRVLLRGLLLMLGLRLWGIVDATKLWFLVEVI